MFCCILLQQMFLVNRVIFFFVVFKLQHLYTKITTLVHQNYNKCLPKLQQAKVHQTLEKSMFFLLFKKIYSISILHGSESLPVVVITLPVVVITIHPPKGRQATPKGQPKDGEVYFPSL